MRYNQPMRRPARESLVIVGSILVGALLASWQAVAKTLTQAITAVSEQRAWQASAIPDRVILTVTATPATAQAVTWRTDTSVAPGQAVAQLAPASAYPKFAEKAQIFIAHTAPLLTDLAPTHCHSTIFTNLKPETLYAYRVGDGTNWSEWFHFRTASDKPKPFSFIYFGDAQNDIKSLWSRAIRSAYSELPKASLLLHAGDLINTRKDAEWGEWHYAAGWINGMTPSLPTPGNHEYSGTKTLTPNWRAQFTLPENGVPGLEETCYFVDYQGVRFVSLNSEEKQAEQAAWLDTLLSKNPNRWTILLFHRPMYSSAKGRDNKELRAQWLPVIEKHRVDLVLQGHDHTYARSQNLKMGVNTQSRDYGTVYVVSVSGPKMYTVEREPWMQRAAENTQLYQLVTVDGGALRYEARTVTGEVYDAFELKKRRSRPNLLIERGPKTPERLGEPSKQ